MRRMILKAMVLIFTLSEVAQAQMWGAGMYGGMQPCPYPVAGAAGATDEDDEVAMYREMVNDLKDELREANKDKRDADRVIKKYNDYLTRHLVEPQAVINDLVGSGSAVNDAACAAPSASAGTAGGRAQNPNQPVQATCSNPTVTNRKVTEYICDVGTASVKPKASRYNADKCKEAVRDYKSAYETQQTAAARVEDLKAQIKDANLALKDAKRDARDARRDSETEGTYCADCAGTRTVVVGRKPSTLESVLGFALAAGGAYLGYRGAKYTIDQNTQMGWPSNPYWAVGLGYPLLAAGIYGATGGGLGAGGIACSPTVGGAYPMGMGGMGGMGGPMGGYGMPGAFGYPGGMGGPMMGGGMWMPGYGPGMMPYPYGGFGLGVNTPYGGFGIGAGMGMPGMGMPGMGGMGYPMGGMGMPGMGMGYPYAGGPYNSPFGFPGMMPGMGGMPYGGLPMGMPGMGMPGMGMPGMGMPGMGMPGMGMPGMGMPGMGMGMPGMGMGMPGMGMGMPGMGMPGMSYPYQQQYMQMYMAQMNAMMQAQQAAMQDQMYRQQTVMGLSQEVARLQMQIYQISMGGSPLMSTGPSVLPYPGPGYGGGGVPTPYPGSSLPGGIPGGGAGACVCVTTPCNCPAPGMPNPYSPTPTPYAPRPGR